MRNKLLFFLIILVLIASGVSYLLWQKNNYSKEILKLEILAPQKAALAQEIEYTVRLKNNGDIRLEEPELIFEYPDHSIVKEGEFLRVKIGKEDFGGAIYPGQEKIFKFKARLIGRVGEAKEAKAQVFYRPKNLTAKYFSKTSAVTIIESVPITFEFDLPSKIEAGRDFLFSLNYFSTIDYPLSDLQINIDYPGDFQFLESTPKGISENEWHLALLNKAEGGRINLKGILLGQKGEEKLFKARFGIWINGELVVLKEATKKVEIVEPSLYIDQLINGSPDYKANLGDILHYQISFKNIGDRPFQHLFLAVKLRGDLFDFLSIKSEKGKNELGDNSIVWDWHDVSKLRFLDAGEEGEVEFWINVKEEGLQDIKNPSLETEILLGQTKKRFVTKVNSKLELNQLAFIDDEIFGSSGPLPPKTGEESLFTIIWRVKNYYSQVKDVKVKSTLPPNVRLTGKIFPEEAKIAFDSKTREIIWQIGDLEPGAGLKEPLQIAFQLALKPTKEQKGKPAILVNEAKITGQDQWTEKELESKTPLIDTQSINPELGIVQ
jgi:hypothetical protein